MSLTHWAIVLAVVLALLVVLAGALATRESRRGPTLPPRAPRPTPQGKVDVFPKLPPTAVLVALLVLAGCTPGQRDTTVIGANVVEATGQGTLAVLRTCTIVLTADAQSPHPAPPGALGIMTDEQHARVVAACDGVEAAYGAIQKAHAVMLDALAEADRVKAAGGSPDWIEVARLGAAALDAVEAGRLAYQAAKVVLAEVSR